MRNEQGISLMQIVVSVIIVMVMGTVVALNVTGYIKDARLAQQVMKAEEVRNELLANGDQYEYEDIEMGRLKEEVRQVLGYHQAQGTNLDGFVFENNVVEKEGEVFVGDVKMPGSEKGNFTLEGMEVKRIKGLSGELYTLGSSVGVLEKKNEFWDVGHFHLGNAHTVYKKDGDLYTWGYNEQGQLGTGDFENILEPKKLELGHKVDLIEVGTHFTLYLTEEDEMYATGHNYYGQLGLGRTYKFRTTFEKWSGTYEDIVTLGSGDSHTFMVDKNGNVWSWGDNGNGELGIGPSEDQNTPQRVYGLKDVVDIGGGNGFSWAFDGEGSMWTWGTNNNGVLGNGGTKTLYYPEKLVDVEGVTSVSEGHRHMLMLNDKGEVYSWGWNPFGGLGVGDKENRSTPIKVDVPEYVKDVQGGYYHSVALTEGGDVYTWGYNSVGQLGLGDLEERLVPVKVEGISNVESIQVGFYHTVAQTKDGRIYVWGKNTSGAFGNGMMESSNVPVEVEYGDMD